MAGFGSAELIGILVIVLLLFGAKKLPELANSMGKSMKEFRKGAKEAAEEGGDQAESRPGETTASS